MTTPGKFITVEGIEGVGKSTNMDFVENILATQGSAVVRSREPGGTPLAERIRELLLQDGNETISMTTELLLFFAARALNVDNLIRPALARGDWVLCDRFTDASRAYQGAGRGVDRQRIETLADWVQEDLRPDLTLLLDAPVELGMKRASRRGEADRMESERFSFYERVRTAYLELAHADPERIVIIDASCDLGGVQTQILRALGPLLSNNPS